MFHIGFPLFLWAFLMFPLLLPPVYYFRYSNLIYWGLTSYPKLKVSILHDKALRTINFPPFNTHTSPSFKICNILKFIDIANAECCIFVNNCFNRDSFSIFT